MIFAGMPAAAALSERLYSHCRGGHDDVSGIRRDVRDRGNGADSSGGLLLAVPQGSGEAGAFALKS